MKSVGFVFKSFDVCMGEIVESRKPTKCHRVERNFMAARLFVSLGRLLVL